MTRPLYGAGVILSLAVGWAGTLPATILVAVALASRGVARRSMWAVAVVTSLYLVVELLDLPARAARLCHARGHRRAAAVPARDRLGRRSVAWCCVRAYLPEA